LKQFVLALANPNHQVFLIFARKVGFFNDSKMPIFDALLAYKNIHISYVDIYDYAENTPLEDWMHEGILFNSTYVVTHTSDILRFLTLWRYTGTYIDLDVIVQRPIESLGSNFACIQKDRYINSAFMNLDMNGRKIAERFFEHTIKNFNPKAWIDNGPGALTKILHEMCNSTEPSEMTRENCDGFMVLPSSNCFEINYPEWEKFFFENKTKEVLRRTENSTIVHFWNYMSANEVLKTKSESAYIQLARKYCPRVLEVSGDFF
jgi:lactosylceramide 4-alpha-galactosyltransferase